MLTEYTTLPINTRTGRGRCIPKTIQMHSFCDYFCYTLLKHTLHKYPLHFSYLQNVLFCLHHIFAMQVNPLRSSASVYMQWLLLARAGINGSQMLHKSVKGDKGRSACQTLIARI